MVLPQGTFQLPLFVFLRGGERLKAGHFLRGGKHETERKALVIVTACLVAGEMGGSLKKRLWLPAKMANIFGIFAAK